LSAVAALVGVETEVVVPAAAAPTTFILNQITV
jgi:hypothetical protein